MENSGRNNANGNHKVGNVNVQIGDKEGIYSDFFPMYKDDVSKYVEHAYLFLNDKDFKCKYSKEKWYAKKRA